MSREVRLVPKNWEHPRKQNNPEKYLPLFKDSYEEAVLTWEEDLNLIKQNKYRHINNSIESISNERKEELLEEHLRCVPEKLEFLPTWKEEELTHIMMYETTSDGTPLSPSFPKENKKELAKWLFDNNISAYGSYCASYEEWLSLIESNKSSGANLLIDGNITNGVELNHLTKDKING